MTRTTEPTTRPSLASDYEHNWKNNPKYQAMPAPLPSSPASHPSYDNGASILSEPLTPAQIDAGHRTRWKETSTRNLYIDWVTPGR